MIGTAVQRLILWRSINSMTLWIVASRPARRAYRRRSRRAALHLSDVEQKACDQRDVVRGFVDLVRKSSGASCGLASTARCDSTTVAGPMCPM